MSKYNGVKLIVNGKRMRDVYPHATRWQVFKYRLFKFIRSILKWSIIIGIIVLGVRYFFPKVMVQVIEREVITDTLQSKIETLKGGIIADIKLGESLGKPESAGLIVYDTNKEMSIGSYQWQIKSVQYYYKKLYKKDITRKEAILIALDDDEAGKLTYDVVFGEKEGWRNWYNTSKKYNIPARLALLEQLTK